MKQFLEDTLHQDIDIKEYEDIHNFPLNIKVNYDFFELFISGVCCILAKPKEDFGLVAFRKHHRKIEQLTEKYCVLCFDKLGTYSREKMLEEGIPFIWMNRQIYMPFLGILLKQNETRTLKPCTKVSFLTQKILLTALLNQWKDVNVTSAAELLGVTKMSVTRCYDEIESLDIPVIQKKGRTRLLSYYLSKKDMWKLIKPHMRNPLLQEFYLEKDLEKDLVKSGISALSEYSMINDNDYKTYAVLKSQLKDIDLRNRKSVPYGETPGCIVQELGYAIDYKGMGAVDPLTVLMLMEGELDEPRIDQAVEEMLEEYVW